MARAPKRRQRSSRKTYKRIVKHNARTHEHRYATPTEVITYSAEDLPPDSALRRAPRSDRD